MATRLQTPNPVSAITMLTTQDTATGTTSGMTSLPKSMLRRISVRGTDRSESQIRFDDRTMMTGITIGRLVVVRRERGDDRGDEEEGRVEPDENRVRGVDQDRIVALLVDERFREAHVPEELQQLDDHRGDGDHAELFGRQQLGQDERREQADDAIEIGAERLPAETRHDLTLGDSGRAHLISARCPRPSGGSRPGTTAAAGPSPSSSR